MFLDLDIEGILKPLWKPTWAFAKQVIEAFFVQVVPQ